MAGQINISGSTEAVQLHGNDSYTVARDFTFPDESGELLIKTANGNVPGVGAINGGPIGGFRNQLINGQFAINQRGGVYGADGLASYTLDRWYHASTPAVSTGSTVRMMAGGPSRGLFRRLEMSDNSSGIQQAIETYNGNNGQFAVGTTWTLSVWSDVDLVTAGWTATPSWRNGLGDGSGITVTDSALSWVNTGEPVDNGYSRYQMTFTVTKNSAQDKNCLVITLPGGNELGGVGVNYAMAQLEPGSQPTPFEMRPIGTELALCQRYFYKLTTSGSIGIMSGLCRGPVEARFTYSLPTTMRVSPIFSYVGATTLYAVSFRNTSNVCSLLSMSTSPDARTVAISVDASGMTAGEAALLVANGTGGLNFDAEL